MAVERRVRRERTAFGGGLRPGVRLVLLLVALLLAAGAARAQAPHYSVLIHCEPTQAEMYLHNPDGSEVLLGHTDSPVMVPFLLQ